MKQFGITVAAVVVGLFVFDLVKTKILKKP